MTGTSAGGPAGEAGEGERTLSRGAVARVLLAYGLVVLSSRLMNDELFPLFEPVFSHARDVCMGCYALACVAAALAALRAPRLLAVRPISVASLAMIAVGAAFTLAGLVLSSAVALAVGAATLMVGSAWTVLVTDQACCGLGFAQTIVGASLVIAASYAAAAGLHLLPVQASLAVELCCNPAALALAFPLAAPDVEALRRSPGIADAALLKPSSYLPIGSVVFVSMFAISVVGGFDLRFGATEGSVDGLAWGVAALLALALWGARTRDHARLDRVFDLVVVVTMAGLLLVPIGYQWFTSGMLTVGHALSEMLFLLVMLAAGRRNPRAALLVFAWGSAVSTAGSILGANIGAGVRAHATTQVAMLASAGVAIAFLAYTQFGMRGFSFAATIRGIEPDRGPVVPASADEGDGGLSEACAAVARDARLTPRELDVLELLARGRNGARIQEELVLARSTVKSYIKHVYAKLDVHSQQELIDLVEARRRGRG